VEARRTFLDECLCWWQTATGRTSDLLFWPSGARQVQQERARPDGPMHAAPDAVLRCGASDLVLLRVIVSYSYQRERERERELATGITLIFGLVLTHRVAVAEALVLRFKAAQHAHALGAHGCRLRQTAEAVQQVANSSSPSPSPSRCSSGPWALECCRACPRRRKQRAQCPSRRDAAAVPVKPSRFMQALTRAAQ
jgi:hypothetical protein